MLDIKKFNNFPIKKYIIRKETVDIIWYHSISLSKKSFSIFFSEVSFEILQRRNNCDNCEYPEASRIINKVIS